MVIMESRYNRQEIVPQFGKAGQAALAEARVAIVGLGALGSVNADILARSGVGYLRLIDADLVSYTNLQRVALYTEEDVDASRPKVLAATRHLEAINSEISIEPQVGELDSYNALEVLSEVDLIIDGTDNFEARALINEAADKLGIPWIYTGVLASMGMVMPITSSGPCFRCLNPTPPEPGSYPTCNTHGILATTTRTAATLQANLAIKMLLGAEHAVEQTGTVCGSNSAAEENTPVATNSMTVANTSAAVVGGSATLFQFDVWTSSFDEIVVKKNPDCPVCGKHHYELLEEHM